MKLKKNFIKPLTFLRSSVSSALSYLKDASLPTLLKLFELSLLERFLFFLMALVSPLLVLVLGGLQSWLSPHCLAFSRQFLDTFTFCREDISEEKFDDFDDTGIEDTCSVFGNVIRPSPSRMDAKEEHD